MCCIFCILNILSRKRVVEKAGLNLVKCSGKHTKLIGLFNDRYTKF